MSDQKPAVTPLSGSRIELAEQKRNAWFITVPQKEDPQALLNPAYWAHIAFRLRARDQLEIWAEDGAWFAQAIVVDRDKNWARIKFVAGPIELFGGATETEVTTSYAVANYDVMWRGPRKWSVVRKGDKQVMHDGEETKDGAQKWLDENASTLKAAA